jgi:hypothetical protein
MNSFTLSKEYTISARSEKTRYGFRHIAVLYRNGCDVARSKCCYYNRTWESYTFQSVIHQLINAHFPPQLAGRFKKKVDRVARGEDKARFNTIAAVASLGSLLFDKPEDKNGFKSRILSTIPGIDIPSDFSSLPEVEKEKRLNEVITILQE